MGTVSENEMSHWQTIFDCQGAFCYEGLLVIFVTVEAVPQIHQPGLP